MLVQGLESEIKQITVGGQALIPGRPVTGLPRWLNGKESACQAGDLGSLPGLEGSPGEGNGYPSQYACLGHHMDKGLQSMGLQKSQT